VEIRPVEPHEATRLRDIRLVALQDAPDAFGSSNEREMDRPLETWAEWLTSGLTLVADDGDGWYGLVVGKTDPDDRSLVHVFSMWVDPAHRRAGLGQRLLDRVVSWAWEAGAKCVRLAVADGNEEALRLYRSYGFVPTGQREPLWSDPARDCVFLDLSRSNPSEVVPR
jgi:ribosomal protein S18 acetylase RimI-like enzyme